MRVGRGDVWRQKLLDPKLDVEMFLHRSGFMPSRTFSSREFSQDAGRAKRAASDGPVFITDRGRPAHVLLTMDDYVRLTGVSRSIVALLAQAGGEEVARVLAVDTAVALSGAGLHVPDPHSDRDAMIAATAMVHGLTVATRNLADFALTGVKLVDPWKTTPPSAP